MNESRKNIFRGILAIAMGTLMVLVAELANEKEIIFPEIAALVIGAWYMKLQPWAVSKVRFVALITASSIIGILIVRYISIPMYFKIMLAFFITSLLITLSKTTFMPLISACILPIYMGTTSVIYPISVFVMALIIAVGEKILEDKNIRNYKLYEKKSLEKTYIVGWIVRYVMFAIMLIPVVLVNKLFLLAPPLIVAFIEFTYINGKCRTNYKKIFGLLFFAGLVGAAFRYANILFNIPLTICALIVLILIFTMFAALEVVFPPVGAIALLPLIINSNSVWEYPIYITIGSAVVIGLAFLVFNKRTQSYIK